MRKHVGYDLVYKTTTTPFFPICLIGHNYGRNFRQLAGVKAKSQEVKVVVSQGAVNWFFPRSLKRIGIKVIDNLINQQSFFLRLTNKEKLLARKLLDAIKTPPAVLFTKRSLNDRGAKLINEIFNLYKEYGYYVDVPGFLFQLYYTPVLKDKLYKEWKNLSVIEKEKLFNLLLSSPQQTNYERFLVALMQNKVLNSLAIRKIAKQFYWLVHDYIGDIVNEKYIKKQIIEMRDDSDDFVLQIKNMQRRIKDIKFITQRLEPSLRVKVVRIHQILWLYNERKKEVINQVNIFIRKLLEYRLNNLNLSQLHDLYQLKPAEIIDLLRGKKIINIKQRNMAWIYDMVDGQIVDGEKKFLSLVHIEKTNVLNGLSASPGRLSGRVCVILNISHIPNFRKGDILVAPFTNVNYLPIMRHAKAIITESGGITSHAAIISRELNKPCIVGIKNLISILRDKDKVLVDANKGIVKKL